MSDFEGFDLDQATARAWTQLQDRLAEHLAAMDDGETLVIDVEANGDDQSGGAYPYVQFAVDEEDVVLEVSSNEVLADLHQLGDYDEKALVMMGLTPPGEPAPDGDTSPNFHLAAPRGDEGRVAVLAVQALRDVLNVPHPAFLRTGSLYPHMTPADITDEEAIEAVVPRNRAHLQELVDRALMPVFGHPPEHDDDGDVPVVNGSALVFVRVLAGVPVVQLFSSVIEDAVDLERAAFEVSVLNRDSGFIRYVLVERRVMAFLDIPAYPFVPLHLRAMLSIMSEAADKVDDDLAARVGGRPGFETHDDDGHHHGHAAAAPAKTAVDDLHPAMQTLLELDADDPGSIDPELAASICGHDRELVLAFIKQCGEQEIAWREQRDHTLVEGDEDDADAAEHEMHHAARMVSLLRRTLRLIVEAQRAHDRSGRRITQHRYRRSTASDEAPTLFDPDE